MPSPAVSAIQAQRLTDLIADAARALKEVYEGRPIPEGLKDSWDAVDAFMPSRTYPVPSAPDTSLDGWTDLGFTTEPDALPATVKDRDGDLWHLGPNDQYAVGFYDGDGGYHTLQELERLWGPLTPVTTP